MAINWEYIGETSDWELADFVIYDQYLSDTQIEKVNRYFKNTYGIYNGSTLTQAAVSASPSTTYASTGDTTLFANWGSAITYDGNKQTSGTAPAPTFITGTSGALASNSGSLARAGWRFDGWNTAADGSGTNYAAGSAYANLGNVLLYAKWTLVTAFPSGIVNNDPTTLNPYMRFKASDYDTVGKTWKDSSGNGRNTSLVAGTPTLSTVAANLNGSTKSFQVVSGTAATESIRFGMTANLTNWTIFNVARYNGVAKQRILASEDGNALYGFWQGKSGVAYHNGWITQFANTVHGDNWVLSTNYYSNYRSNGISRTLYAGGDTALRPIAINHYSGEKSDFQVAEILVFDYKLTDAQILKVEDYLAATYGISNYTPANTYPTSSSFAFATTVGGRTDTFTAAYGLGTKSFSISPAISGITIDTSTANGVAVVVSSLVPTGTYSATLTATDQSGATATHLLNLTVAPPVKFDTSTATTIITTHRRGATLQLNTIGGTGTKVFTMTSAGTGITLDTTTAASGYATLRVDTYTAIGSYTQIIAVTDDTKVRSTFTVTIVINAPPTLASTSVITTAPVLSDLKLNLDAGDTASYAGSGTTWTDLSGNGKSATWQTTAPFSKDFGGSFTHARATNQYASTATLGATDVFSVEVWVKFKTLNVNLNYPCLVSDAYLNTLINYSICFRGNNVLMGGYHRSGWTLTSGFTPVAGTWYQFVYTVSKSGSNYISTLFQNGNMVGTPTTATMIPGNSGGSTFIGRRWDGEDYIDGSMPVVRIYNRALSTSEITQNYNALLPRFANNPTNSVTITTTESMTASSSIYYAGLGTGNKTFALSNSTTGISIDTATVNTVKLNVASTVSATSSTVARTISQIISATDSTGLAAATPVYVTTVINPKVLISASTATTLSTTYGVAAYDTFTATYGTGASTFSGVSSSYQSGFVVSNPSSNVGLLTVASNLPAGTYYETITATDSVGASTIYLLTVIINPPLAIAGSPSNSVSTTVGKATSLRINITNGTGSKNLTFTSPGTGITLDTTTVSSGYATVNLSSATPVGSFTFSLYAVDSSKYTTSISITATVNRWPVIGTPSIISSGLKISLDAGNSSSYSGSGKTWSDLSGNGKTGTWQQTPNFSSNSGGTIAMGSTTTQYMAAAGLGATNVFTAEAWVKFTSIPTQDNCILSDKYNASYINFSICFRNDSKVYGGYWNASNGWIISAGTSVTTNTWYHFAYTVSLAGSTYTSLLYLNSSQVGAAVTSTVAPSSGSTGFLVGTNWRADTTVVSGDIAIVRVYSKALSKNEVVQNYNAQGLRFTATNSGTDTATVTQGTAGSVLNVAATEGTGTKTFAITDLNSGVSLDNSVANSYTLNLASTLTATSTTVAKTITETVTATDSMAATTTRVYTITINPPIKVESTTATVTTTSGIAAWDTFTATFGTGNKIFSLTGSPSTSGFTLTQSANQAVLKVEPTANPGTYLETITATDTLGATKSVMVTIIVAPGPIILGANTLVAAKTIAFRSPTYSVVSGIAPFTYSLTSTAVSPSSNPTSGITFDATTMTLRVSATVLSGTYVETLTVTDSKGATSRFSISLTVKDPVSLTGSLDIVKTYGDLSVNAYTINNGVSAYGFRTTVGSTSDVCVPITGAVDANTYEMITSIGACNWIAPTGVSAADYVVAAGGGGGGSGRAGGGGGGGVATGTGLTLTGGSTYGITIGSGGAAATSATLGSQGGDSWIGTTDGATKYVSAGGGGGGGTLSLSAAIGNGATGNNAPSATVKSAGGAGGGGGLNFATGSPTTNYYRQGGASGAGTEASYSGGNSYRCDSDAAKADGQKSVNAGRTTGGGGGAGGTGIGFTTGAICPTFTVTPPNGGAAVSTTLTGSTLYFGGGGGGSDGRFIGGVEYEYGSSGRGTGTNGGGNGQQVDVPTSASNATLVLSALPASSGTDNTGGGGGGGISSAGSGGSGALIMRYATPTRVTNAISLATVSNGSSSTAGSVVLTIPENVTAGSTTKSIKVTDLNGSTVYTVNITINQATPVVTISLPGSVATGKYGTAVTLSAVVSTDGIVEFKDAATVISGCSAVASSSGIATCSWIPSVLGSRSITATLTPTDSVNYLPSISTYSVSIGKADTLTVTASSENFTYSESPALITKPFTYSGLASIDTLTAVEMIYTGIANDTTIINSSSGPTPAGTYVITPNVSTAGISLISGNYSSVSLVPGTLTISRAVPTTVFAYPNSNVTTYSIDGTLSSVTTSSSGSGIKSYSTTTPTICSIESSTALVSILKAGSCLVSMDVTESANYLAKSQPTTITIEKAARTITLTSPVGTLKYYETTTATAVISDGSSDGTLTYSLNATPGCSFDPLSGIITATSGTLACTLNSTVAEGENYLLAATTSPLALTIAKADAPGIVINPVSAVDHLPNTRAQISPTYSISGLKGSDSASQLTLTYGFVSNPFEAFIYSDTLTPIDAGTYSITPSNLVMSSGLLTNYETPNYSGSTINFIVNQIAQAPVTIDNFNGEITVPFYLLVSGGSNPSATPEFNKISGTTCTLTDNRIDATSSGQCQVTVTIPANRNYLAATSDTATILIRNYQIVPVFNFGNGSSGIPLSTKTPLTIGVISCVTGCAPTITSASPDSARVGDVIILTGTNFTGVIRIVFNIFIDAIMFNADSDTQITVQIPEGVIPTDMDGIDVITPGGTSMRFYDFTILP